MREKDRQTETLREKDRQTDRQAGRQADRQRQRDRDRDKQADRQTQTVSNLNLTSYQQHRVTSGQETGVQTETTHAHTRERWTDTKHSGIH